MKDTHMRTMTHLIAGSIAAMTLVAGTAVTASAQSTTIKDKRADVVQYENINDMGDGSVLNREDSTQTGVDVTSTSVKHGKKGLRVKIRFSKLAKTPVTTYTEIQVKGSNKRYNVSNMGLDDRVFVHNRSYSKYLCDAKLSRKTGKNGWLSFTIPRSCLKNPRSIKVRSDIFAFEGEFGDETAPVNSDAISNSKVRNPSWTKWLKAS